MAYIETIPVSEATGEVRELYLRQQGNGDYVPNYAKVYCYRPQVMKAWADLQKCIRRPIDAKRYGLVSLAVARAIGSSYCALSYGRMLQQKFYSTDALKVVLGEEARKVVGDETLTVVEEESRGPLSPAEWAMMRYAAKVATDSSSVTQADIDELKTLGFSDAEIFDIAASAAARCFFARLGDALGAKPDSAFLTLDPQMREALTVGRAIDQGEAERLPAPGGYSPV